MDRVYESGASASPPSPPASPSSGYPTPGAPGVAAATLPGPWWHYMMTEELRSVIVAAGLTPDHTNVAQLLAALDARFVNESQFTGANQLLDVEGYQMIPGGLIRQWGFASAIPTMTNKVVTLPVAFTTTCFAAYASYSSYTSDASTIGACQIRAVGLTSITVRNLASTTSTFSFFVIGK